MILVIAPHPKNLIEFIQNKDRTYDYKCPKTLFDIMSNILNNPTESLKEDGNHTQMVGEACFTVQY